MINVSELFKQVANRDSRTFRAKAIINDIEYKEFREVKITQSCESNTSLSFGSTSSACLNVTIVDVDKGVILTGQKIKLFIGLKTNDSLDMFDDDSAYTYIQVGEFNVDTPSWEDSDVKITAYDHFYLCNQGFFTNLSGMQKIKNIVSEQCTKLGIEFVDDIEDVSYNVDVLKGLTIREAFGYLASFLGKNAIFNNLGKLQFVWYTDSQLTIDSDRFSSPLTIGNAYAIGSLSCTVRTTTTNDDGVTQNEDTTYTSGSGEGIQFSNLYMTQERLNTLLSRIQNFSIRSAQLNWNMALPQVTVGDIINIKDVDNTIYAIPVMEYTINIDGGCYGIVESKFVSQTEQSKEFKGSLSQQVERIYTDYGSFKEIITEKITAFNGEFVQIDADFVNVNQKLTALEGQIGDLDVTELSARVATIEEAYISKAQVEQLYATKAEVGTISANVAEIQEAMIGVAYVDDLNALEAKINEIEAGSITTDYLETNYAKIDLSNIENGCITTAMIQTGAIGTAQIADGSITDAKIVGLTANKITAGTIDASDIEVINLNCANLTVGTINGQQIANNAIDWDKLNSQVSGTINSANSNASQALEDALEAMQEAQSAANAAQSAQTTANGKNTVFYQSTQPAVSGRKVNDIWYDTDDGYKMYYFNGTSWQAVEFGENAIANDAISADKIASDVNSKINDAFTNAGIAISDSSNALSKANTAINDASTAKSNASTALSTANSAKSTADSALDSINNLEIGGRNLVLNSGTEVTNSNYNISGYWLSPYSSDKVGNTNHPILVEGDTYTISVKAKIASGTNITKFTAFWSGYVWFAEWTPVFDENHIYTRTFVAKHHTADSSTFYDQLDFYVFPSSATRGESTIYWVKIEKGTKATDWTPAPEDVDNAIELVQTTADGKNTVFYQTSAPSTSNRKVNDVWFDTDDSNKMYYWNGSAWTARQFGTNAIANLAITNALIADGTIQNAKIANLDAAKITSGFINVARLQAGSITADKLKADTITAASGVIADAAILTANIADLAVSSGKIANAAIGTAKIADLAVTNAKLADLSVTNAKIADATIQSAKIASLDAGKITSGYISSDRIQAGSLVIGKLDSSTQNTINNAYSTANNSVLTTAMASGKMLFTDPSFATGNNALSVYNNSANGTVTMTRISRPSDSPITSSGYVLEIKNTGTSSPGCGGFRWSHGARANAVFIYKIIAKLPSGRSLVFATNSIGTGNVSKWIANPTGDGNNYKEYIYYVHCGYTGSFSSTGFFYLNGAYGSISSPVTWYIAYATCFDCTNVNLDYNSIISNWCYNNDETYINGGKIYTGTVAAAQIAANAITSDKISANAVIAGKIAANAVTTGTIAADAVTSAKIAADAITAEHVAANAITTDNIVAGAVTGAKIAASTITANNIAANTITAAKIASGTITATQIASGTITATQLASNSVTAVKIAANAVTADKIAANAITSAKIATDAIKSRNYVANSTGSYLNLQDGSFSSKNLKWTRDGTLTATNANFTGKITGSTISGGAISGTTITATSGKIGGWNLSSNELTSEYGNSKIQLHSHSSAEKGYIGIVGEDDETKRLYNVTLVCNDIDAAVTIKSEGLGDVRISPYKIEIFNSDYQIANSTHAMVLKAYQYLHLYSNVNVTAKVGEYTNVLCGTNGDMSVSSSIYMNSNNKYIYGKTTTGVSLRNIIPCNSGNNCMIGYGGYENKMAETNIYGNAVKLTTMTSISGNKAYTNTSDIRFKKNINPIDDVFYKIWEQLTPVEFEWNEKNNPDGKINFGLTAQSVIEAISDYGLDYKKYAIINTFTKENDTTEYYSVAYDYYHMLTAKALKKTINRVDTHDRDLQVLRNENAQLKQELKNTQDKLDAFINNNFQVREVIA